MGTGGTAAPMAPRGPRAVGSRPQPRSLSGPRRSPFAWTPFKPVPIPAGSYNPSLDAEQAATERGTSDLRGESITALTRGNSDYQLGKEGFERTRTEGDQEIGQARARSEQDTSQALAKLTTAYRNLATTQEEQQNGAGVLNGGAVLAAAAKRTANQGTDEAPIKQAQARNLEDLAMKQRQLDEGSERSLGNLALHDGPVSDQVLRLAGELSNPSARSHAQAELAKIESTPGEAGLLGGRTAQDIITKLVHGERENQAFGVNIAAQKAHEAAAFGYVPPTAPGNEHLRRATPASPGGTSQAGGTSAPQPAKPAQRYHTISHGHEWWDVTPAGQVIKRRPKK